jgi:hypothetical protein
VVGERRKIDFLHQQTALFAADQESRLPSVQIAKLDLATDSRQTGFR